MKTRTISIAGLVVCGAFFVCGYLAGAKWSAQKPTYLAVSLVTDRFLHSVATVVQDEDGSYVVKGDEIVFMSEGPKTFESTLRPFAFEFQRWDFFSPNTPRGVRTFVPSSQRAKQETFLIREGKIQKINILARDTMTP